MWAPATPVLSPSYAPVRHLFIIPPESIDRAAIIRPDHAPDARDDTSASGRATLLDVGVIDAIVSSARRFPPSGVIAPYDRRHGVKSHNEAGTVRRGFMLPGHSY